MEASVQLRIYWPFTGGAVVLPHGTGKSVKVLVFAKGAKLDEAQAAGADHVGGEELIPKIQNDGWLDFDVVAFTSWWL